LRELPPTEKPEKGNPRRSAPDLRPILGGEERETPWGSCHIVETVFPLDHKWGSRRIRDTIAAHSLDGLARVALEELPQFDFARTLFLDTETTGLSGGTGTYAFLVGTGRFTERGFVVKQFLMRDYNEELPLLYCLEEELQKTDTIISFNGKAFDIPLLRTRFALTRLPFHGVDGHGQVDLLHLSRRLWKDKLESCSLLSLEVHILGLARLHDIPGSEIPQRYFQFLQTGSGFLLKDILEHNVYDIVSMAVLVGEINTRGLCSPEDCTCPLEAEALAMIHAHRGQLEAALCYIDQARALAHSKEQHIRLLRTAALLNKRLRRYDTAAALWQRLLDLDDDDLLAYEELAKHYEHRLKDFSAAGRITRRALAVALRIRSPKVPELEHRLRRLTKRQEATGSAPRVLSPGLS